MEEIVKLDNVAAYNKMRGVPTFHPLVTVIDLSKAQPMPAKTFNFGLYAVYRVEMWCTEVWSQALRLPGRDIGIYCTGAGDGSTAERDHL